jgi:hypothetical protein
MFSEKPGGTTALGESRNLKDLDEVLSNDNALRAFRSGRPLNEAVLYTNKPIEIFAKSINRSIDSLRIARDQMHNIDPNESLLNGVDEVIRIATDLKILIKGKISG